MEGMTPLPAQTIEDALELMWNKQLRASDLASACLDNIQRLNPKLNAFITVQDSLARSVASTMIPASAPRATYADVLRGIPIAVKDLFDTAGIRTTAGSKFFADRIPDEDAFVVEKLKAAGAFIIGKTNTHEIALGVTGNNLILALPETRAISPASRAARRADRQSPWQPAWRWARLAQTPAVRSASPLRCAAWWDSSPRMGASACAACSPSRGISTTSVRWLDA